MADRCCNYCEDMGDCIRCSYFFEKDKIHKRCGKAWKDREVLAQEFYPPWAVCEDGTW